MILQNSFSIDFWPQMSYLPCFMKIFFESLNKSAVKITSPYCTWFGNTHAYEFCNIRYIRKVVKVLLYGGSYAQSFFRNNAPDV